MEPWHTSIKDIININSSIDIKRIKHVSDSYISDIVYQFNRENLINFLS